MALELLVVERRMRRAYELGRLKRAVAQSVPLVALTGLALYAGSLRPVDIAVGSALILTALVYLWRGQLAERALKPGLVAGLFPLILALVANGPNPGCHQGDALSLCTLACAVGGVIAAFRLNQFTRTEAHAPTAFGFAVFPTLLLGSLGCGCMGFTGVLAMSGALLLVSLPMMLRWA